MTIEQTCRDAAQRAVKEWKMTHDEKYDRWWKSVVYEFSQYVGPPFKL